MDFTKNLEHFMEIFSGWISMPLTFILIGTGLFVTVSLGFIQVRRLKHSFDVVSGKYDNPDDEGDVTHFQALSAALSATIGIGNIAGVALAVRLGGPGALFWMWVTALFGMALKYAECTLSHKYRVIHDDGSVSGGPMYYIEKGLGPKWKPLAIFFATCAVICSFCTGNMNQANTIAQTFASYNVPIWISGSFIAFMVGLVIIGGIKRIAAVASRIVPTMAVLYVSGALLILLVNYQNIIHSLESIFREAFSLKSGWGGLFAVIMWGVRRGLYSNEAGQGSAPIAHAAAKTKESAREGAVAMMGPFIDTIIVCTMTGLAILSTGVLESTDLTGAQLTREAFRQGFTFAPELGSIIVNFSVLLFAYTTMVAW
ncbi:MAG: sodium:alanine symporter family protein, partial [Candidatus Neomarinimicrobiota bacterium]|nr:sodium:alanine symporter family protein [Candidatus Neomarinimicrobiota bacterium]